MVTPNVEYSKTPEMMKPMTKPTWQYYSDPESLAASGIYIGTDLENLIDHIIFQQKKLGLSTKHRDTWSKRRAYTNTKNIALSLNLDENSTKNHGKCLEENLRNVFIFWQCNFRNN